MNSDQRPGERGKRERARTGRAWLRSAWAGGWGLLGVTLGVLAPTGGWAAAEPATSAATTYVTLDEAIARGDVADVRRHLAVDPARARTAAPGRLAPLHEAILRRQAAIVAVLIDAGASVDAADNRGRTPLHMAVERGDENVVALLLDHRANPAKGDAAGWRPLHHAAARNQVGIARRLLAAGLDPNLRSELGGTALHEAAASGGPEMVVLLLERGCNPGVRSKAGQSALDIAREFKNEAVIPLLAKAEGQGK